MRRPDLHLHTTASDGQFDVWQVARLVARADVTLFAITDHDTLDALPAAADAAYERGLAFLPGVEISTEGDEEVHVLGYGVRHDDPVLNGFFQTMREDRVNRVRLIGDQLKALGMELPETQAMLKIEKKPVLSVKDERDMYIMNGIANKASPAEIDQKLHEQGMETLWSQT